ncbi:MAG TPA: type II secretion system F family protein [Gemmatimonadaceae bacterium]|nr:type II secretion system F family protein [Gemmatimonadaceae bacterium]
MPIVLIGLIWLGIAALAVAGYLALREKSRRDVMDAIGGEERHPKRRAILTSAEKPLGAFGKEVLRRAPTVWTKDESIQEQLVHAGFDSPNAPAFYAVSRVALLVLFPLMALLFAPHDSLSKTFVVVVAAAFFGLLLPVGFLLRSITRRQNRIRRSLPDALDLLVVCVEAGISLDAAILRVARDMVFVHPELSRELVIVNRKTNAGITREVALRGLWDRTGVEELRTLVSSLIQSEKWGTSSSRVLRITAETLRRKRKFTAEKKAATAPIKMLIPMALLIFPALFVVILGPAVMKIVGVFSGP